MNRLDYAELDNLPRFTADQRSPSLLTQLPLRFLQTRQHLLENPSYFHPATTMSVPDFTNMPDVGLGLGVTPLNFFKVGYDQNSNVTDQGLTRATNFFPLADGIFTYLQKAFPGVTIPNTPIQL